MKFEYGMPYYFIGGYRFDIAVPIIRVLVFIKKEEHANNTDTHTYLFQDGRSFVNYGDSFKCDSPYQYFLYFLSEKSIEHVYDLEGFIDEIIMINSGHEKPIPDEVWSEILIEPLNAQR